MHPRLQVHNSAGAMVLNSSKRSKDRGYSSMKGFKYRERHQRLRLMGVLSQTLSSMRRPPRWLHTTSRANQAATQWYIYQMYKASSCLKSLFYPGQFEVA